MTKEEPWNEWSEEKELQWSLEEVIEMYNEMQEGFSELVKKMAQNGHLNELLVHPNKTIRKEAEYSRSVSRQDDIRQVLGQSDINQALEGALKESRTQSKDQIVEITKQQLSDINNHVADLNVRASRMQIERDELLETLRCFVREQIDLGRQNELLSHSNKEIRETAKRILKNREAKEECNVPLQGRGEQKGELSSEGLQGETDAE